MGGEQRDFHGPRVPSNTKEVMSEVWSGRSCTGGGSWLGRGGVVLKYPGVMKGAVSMRRGKYCLGTLRRDKVTG